MDERRDPNYRNASLLIMWIYNHFLVSKNVLTTTKENPPTTMQQELSKCHLDNTRLYNAIVQLKKKSSAVSKGTFL